MATSTFSHVGLTCKDPILIERFYTKYFGFKRVRVYVPGPDQVVVIRSGALALEIFKANEESPIAAPLNSGYEFPGYRHICFEVDDLEAKLKELGEDAKLTLGPVSMNELIARYFVTPTRPVDAVPKIVTKLRRMGWEFPPFAENNERGYVQMRVYELRRRGLMEVSE